VKDVFPAPPARLFVKRTKGTREVPPREKKGEKKEEKFEKEERIDIGSDTAGRSSWW